jgi:hypothetical protein
MAALLSIFPRVSQLVGCCVVLRPWQIVVRLIWAIQRVSHMPDVLVWALGELFVSHLLFVDCCGYLDCFGQ